MSTPAHRTQLRVAEGQGEAAALDLPEIRDRLRAAGGGVHVVHSAAAFELRVEVFTSPGPGAMRVERRGDVLYLVLAGNAALGVEGGEPLALATGEAGVVPAGAGHVLFGDPEVSLLVVTAPGRIPVAPLALCRRA